MSTKTITVKEESYNRLAMRKKPNESFSDVIDRLTGKGSILEFAGLLSKKEGLALEKNIRDARKKSSERLKRFYW